MITASVGPARATVVAWYRDQPVGLTQLADSLQRAARTCIGEAFTPRPLPDLHATILGLESPVPGACRDLDGVLRHLVAEFEQEPVDVQFGGFADADRRMLSRGKILRERSLVLQGTTLVLIGWPMAPGPSARMGEIRRRCERYGFRHKYHRQAADLDADIYLALGDIGDPAQAGPVEVVERLRREVLATAVRVPLTAEVVSLVEYVDARLPAATSTWRPLAPGRRPW